MVDFFAFRLLGRSGKEVRGLVQTLALKIEACPAEMNCQALASSLYGLQGMSSQWPEVHTGAWPLARLFWTEER